MIHRLAFVSAGLVAIAMSICMSRAAETVSATDKSFVAMVSQGGMYEVALGKVAEKQGSTQDIKDQGSTETHDHDLVGAKLKSIAEANGLEFPNSLNAEFQKRLEKISALSGQKFDSAYIDDMKKIHEADGAAFQKEAKNGSNADLRSFAAETHRIVERHIGELGVTVH